MMNVLRLIGGWIRNMMILSRPGGVKALAAENLALRQRLITHSRQYKRSPKLNGYLRIAMQIKNAFGIDLDEGVVRWVLAKHRKETPSGEGPSWLTFIGHMKDSLWSVDLFRRSV